MTSIWGKLVGGGLGLVFGGPVGAFVGAAVGHAVDLNLENITLSIGNPSSAQAAFFEAVFLIMGHTAKADGRVSENEIRVAEQVMTRLQLNASQRQLAISLFNRGKRNDFDLPGTLANLRKACGSQPQLFRLLIETLLDAGFADGQLAPKPRYVIEQCAIALGITDHELNNMTEQRQQGYRRSKTGRVLVDPYQVLGLREGADEKSVKQAYRRLISQNHPDKLVAKGLPQEMLELAKEKTSEIRAAYEQIREARGFR
ncbi:MAG: co-chaperone DjlA [Pseudomonadota bacterium]